MRKRKNEYYKTNPSQTSSNLESTSMTKLIISNQQQQQASPYGSYLAHSAARGGAQQQERVVITPIKVVRCGQCSPLFSFFVPFFSSSEEEVSYVTCLRLPTMSYLPHLARSLLPHIALTLSSHL
jgi:hypothetical protein